MILARADGWICLLAGLTALLMLAAPFAFVLALRVLVKWDDRRRDATRSARGFEVNDVKSNTGESPVADTERETNNG